MYEWRALDELAAAAFRLGRYEEALESNEKQLKRRLSEGQRDRARKNAALCREAVTRG